jgi:adenosylmethionine-8-amino-7-oxononanoate aminotransferase
MGYAVTTSDHAELEAKAKRHLWMHFTRLGAFTDKDVPIIQRGEGAYLFDDGGRRYQDALSGLFVVQAGHGRAELAEAGATQARDLAYFPIWSHAHPTAVELAATLADRAPGDLNRVFFTTGGSEAVESAWKLARQYFKAVGEPGRYKVIARNTAYHGTTMGALAITGIPALKAPFEPIMAGVTHVANTNRYRSAFHDDITADDDAFSAACADAIEQAIVMEGPDTVAAVFLEPVQNAGGCLPPPPGYFQRVRDICDRHGVLLVSDEVICAYGRLGHLFGCERYEYLPDMITSAKGLTSGYSPLGAVICRDFLAEPFLAGAASFTHGITFAGHPVSCAVALANLAVFDREDLCGNVLRNEDGLRGRLESLRDLPLVGDVRGAGYFWALELVRGDSGERFARAEVEPLLRGFLAPRLFELGLICRTDDRGDPVIQFAPTLVAGPDELDEIADITRAALSEAWKRFNG